MRLAWPVDSLNYIIELFIESQTTKTEKTENACRVGNFDIHFHDGTCRFFYFTEIECCYNIQRKNLLILVLYTRKTH